ncbi:MAG: hypothetical protein HRT89_19265 [Lentisphaeria bacterium]|nr:hypothetical protein [Lentisphaeria bacterium]NQZ70198.1 hypothetical protein [Lentisphaeria bacterium]
MSENELRTDIFNAGTHNADGVDLTQIREMLALSVEERLHWLELSVNSQLALQENIKAKSKSALK